MENSEIGKGEQKVASQLNTILLLFILLRLTIVFFYTPRGLFNVYTDYYFYYRTAQLFEGGYLPFINMWYEYPPLLAYLPYGPYGLVRAIMPIGEIDSLSYLLFARIFATIMLLFEVGVLILLVRIATDVWGTERANWLGWVYTALSLPLFIFTYSHQAVVVFFVLLAMFLFLQNRYTGSAIALGLGVLAKLVPIFLLAPVVRFLYPHLRKIAIYALITAVTIGSVYLLFIIIAGKAWVMASLVALTKVSSWSTAWAILDGNWGPGNYGPLSTRLDLAQAYVTRGNPPVIPVAITTLFFGMIYGWITFRKIETGARQFIWLSTVTAVIVFLWSKGWSPAWAMMLIPMILLSFPDKRGLALVLGLSLLAFLEEPFASAFESRLLLMISIAGRTALLIYLAVLLVRQIWSQGGQHPGLLPGGNRR